MLLDQRRQEILSLVETEGFVALQQLTDRAGVSESTVRRDLEYLEKIGQIRRTRGGAAYVGESITPLDERAGQAFPEKQAVGRAAAALVQGGGALLPDGRTTTLAGSPNLPGQTIQV